MKKHLIDNYLDDLQEIVPLIAVGLAFSAANVLIGATNLYKKNFTKAALRCKDLPEREKAICMLQAKMSAKNIQLQALKSNLAKCNTSKNPDRCKKKIVNKMQAISTDVRNVAIRYKQLKTRRYS